MARAQVAPVRELRQPAEVRRLVPAEPGTRHTRDDTLEVRLHRLGLARELGAVRVGEARPPLCLQLVAGEVLRFQRERLAQVGVKVGGALAGDPVDQIERDVVKSDITQSVDRAPDVVRARASFEHREQPRLEALRAERDPRHAAVPQQRPHPGRDRLRIRLDRDLLGRRQGTQQAPELGRRGERRRSAAEKDALEPRRQHAALKRELGEQRIHVGPVLTASPDHRDEVAIPAARSAEGQVQIQVPNRRARAHFLPPSRFRTARNASCGTSTEPTCFIRFLPFFCCSSSFRFRVMSPP